MPLRYGEQSMTVKETESNMHCDLFFKVVTHKLRGIKMTKCSLRNCNKIGKKLIDSLTECNIKNSKWCNFS